MNQAHQGVVCEKCQSLIDSMNDLVIIAIGLFRVVAFHKLCYADVMMSEDRRWHSMNQHPLNSARTKRAFKTLAWVLVFIATANVVVLFYFILLKGILAIVQFGEVFIFAMPALLSVLALFVLRLRMYKGLQIEKQLQD